MAEEFYSIGKGEIRQDALLKVTGQAEYTTCLLYTSRAHET